MGDIANNIAQTGGLDVSSLVDGLAQGQGNGQGRGDSTGKAGAGNLQNIDIGALANQKAGEIQSNIDQILNNLNGQRQGLKNSSTAQGQGGLNISDIVGNLENQLAQNGHGQGKNSSKTQGQGGLNLGDIIGNLENQLGQNGNGQGKNSSKAQGQGGLNLGDIIGNLENQLGQSDRGRGKGQGQNDLNGVIIQVHETIIIEGNGHKTQGSTTTTTLASNTTVCITALSQEAGLTLGVDVQYPSGRIRGCQHNHDRCWWIK